MRKTLIIKPAILACSAGLLLTACHTERAERHHARYSSTSQDQSWMEGSGAQNNGYNSAYNSQSQNQDYSSGQSYSSSASQDYNSSSQASAQSQSSQAGQNEIVIPLHEEQVNVGKRTVDAGQVTIRKIIKTETVNQPIELRHETLVIDREGAGAEARSSAQSSQSSAQLNAQSTAQTDSSTARTDSNWQKGAFNQNQDQSSAQAENQQQSSSQAADQQSQASTEQSSANEPAGASYQQSQRASSSSDLNNGSAFQEQTYTIQLKKEVPVIDKSVVQTGQVVARKNSQMQQQTIQQQIRKEDVQLDKSGAAAQNVQIRGDFNTAGKNISEPSGAERPDTLQNNSSQQSTSGSATESIQHDSAGAQKIDSGVDESTDSTTRNRAPTKGQGAQDLKKGIDEEQP